MSWLDRYREEIVDYRKWLEKMDRSTCARFLKRLDSNNQSTKEGAVTEATSWCWLSSRCSSITLEEHPGKGGVDFKCMSENGFFYVEATSLGISAVSKYTGLQHKPNEQSGFSYYQTASKKIKSVVANKATQSCPKDGPLLIMISSLHAEFSSLLVSTDHLSELFLGKSKLQSDFNHATGEATSEPESVATLDHPLFFNSNTLKPARQNLSGIIVGGFGLARECCDAIGLLNSAAVRPFARFHLPDVCFGSLAPWPPNDSTSILWERADGTDCRDDAEHERHIAKSRKKLGQAGFGDLLDEIDRENERNRCGTK